LHDASAVRGEMHVVFLAKIAWRPNELTLETSPATMPTAWVNFLKQRFHLLGVEYNYIGAGRIVLTTSPRTAESVVRLLISAIEIANDHVKTVGR
jgi:hypothetical protein